MTLLDRVAPVCAFEESNAMTDGLSWSAKLLYETAEKQKCRAEKFPLKFVNTSASPFESSDRLCDMIYHARRINNADTGIPIIISPLGGILDGYHRVARAMLDVETSIMCYRLKDMPEPDGDRSGL